MINNQVVARIAQKIRSIRLERKLTLQELATRTQVSKGLISKIENQRTVPSLPVFITLLHSMNISPEDFFSDAILDRGKVRLIKRDQYINPLTSVNAGLQTQAILSQNISRCTMEIAHLTLEPGFSGEVAAKNGHVFHYILVGSCYYKIKNDLFVLEEGDVMFIDTTIECLLINKTTKNVVILSMHFAS